MKFRVRNEKTMEIYNGGVFLGGDGVLYNRVLEPIGKQYVVEPCLFSDKNKKSVYLNDRVILEKTGDEYLVKLSARYGIVLENLDGKISQVINAPSEFILKEDKV